MTTADLILRSIDEAFAECIDDEGAERLDEMWEARSMETARRLTKEAGIEWDFESWTETARLIRQGRGQWANLSVEVTV